MSKASLITATKDVYQDFSLVIRKDKTYEMFVNYDNEICITGENSSRVIFAGNLEETQLLINNYFK